MSGSKTRKSFKTRLLASIFVWGVILLLAVSFGFIINSKSERRKELLGSQLPDSGLTLAQGKITGISYRGDGRRGTFATPMFEFETGGRFYRTKTVRSYSIRELPLSDGQNVEVVFVDGDPDKAWLKWEYDDLMAEYNSFWVKAYDAIGPTYNYLAATIILLTALCFTVNLFVPLLGFIKL